MQALQAAKKHCKEKKRYKLSDANTPMRLLKTLPPSGVCSSPSHQN